MVSINNDATPIIILGSDYYWGLGILRSLGRLGIPLYTASSNPHAPAFFSRYCRRKILSDITQFTEQAVHDLLTIGGKIGRRAILIPTTDQGAIFVADHADALREWFMFPNQSADLVRSLCSKKDMYYLARKFGVPTAESIFPQDREDVLNFLKTASFPIMLKPIHSWRPLKRRGVTSWGGIIVNTRRELLEIYDAIEDTEKPNLVLQEYIPGGDEAQWMFNAYFNEHSDCLFGLTGKKIRQWPIHHGAATLGILLRNETVEKTTRELMKAVGYRGILNIGYRYDARDGQYKILDINPRIGATFRLFVGDNGIDVARALYLDMTGKPITPGVAHSGRKWFVEDFDLQSSFLYHLEGNLRFNQWIDSYRGVREAAYFTLDDPLPFLRMLARNIDEFFLY